MPFAPMTPRASPSVAPSDHRPVKRPRLSKSTLRVLSVWDQLAERYNKRLDEDDILDLYSGTIISDRGVLKGAGKDYNIGHFAPDDTQDDQEQEQADSEQEQDDDADELDTLPAQNLSGTDGTMASTSELLRAVPPLSAATDADDLNEFLEAEKRRRELLGDQDGEDDMSMEELAAVREALRQPQDEDQPEIVQEDDSDDELSVWQHDASAVYHIARNESEQDVAECEQKINELTESDEEFATLLERPPRVEKRKRISPSPPQRGISSRHMSVLNTPTVLRTRLGSRISSQDTQVPDTPPAASGSRFGSSISSQDTSVPDTPPGESSTRFASCISSKNTPVPDFHQASSSRFTFRMSSENTPVPDTPPVASYRSASHTPRTPVYPFPPHSVELDPAQSPQHLLYQAMQHLSFALSATMSSYGSPHMPPLPPPPPPGSWGTYPPGFVHPWAPRGTPLDDDRTLVDDDSTPGVDSDSGVLESERRRRRSTSSIGSGKDTRNKGIHSGRSRVFDQEEKRQGKRIAARRRASGSPFPEHGSNNSASANKKKRNAKSKS